MQFKTKRMRSRRPGLDFSVPLSGGIDGGAVIESEGVPYIRESRQVDIVADETVIGAVQFKVGQRVFPALYGHRIGGHSFIGETVDAKQSGDGSTWIILLRVLDGNGDPATIDDERVEIWFREPDLTKLDASVGVVSITPGQSINSNEVLRAAHTQKLVGFRTLHRVRDCNVYGPKRPDVKEDDEHVNAERRNVSEQAWRVVSIYQDQPLTIEDPEWTEKLTAVNLLFSWLRQKCPRRYIENEDKTVTVEPYVIR